LYKVFTEGEDKDNGVVEEEVRAKEWDGITVGRSFKRAGAMRGDNRVGDDGKGLSTGDIVGDGAAELDADS
jgi:hypothetical protein